ncbi:hypothetical protein RRG08_008116 [Elysia crispata]|uniref:Integrase zinc-binding domain-containing protein n=1 Tax=Elysia crispata TaxID=231223 RepID=A0AAE0YBF7_9GAST|nr:hypothetical protein RRG08_008116 [Elysia crispata]
MVLGVEKSKTKARQSTYWPGMTQDIDNMVRQCQVKFLMGRNSAADQWYDPFQFCNTAAEQQCHLFHCSDSPTKHKTDLCHCSPQLSLGKLDVLNKNSGTPTERRDSLSELRFFDFMVHHLKRFDYIKMTFPEGGLSYKECDKELGQVDTKACISVPSDRMAKFREASKNPAKTQGITTLLRSYSP